MTIFERALGAALVSVALAAAVQCAGDPESGPAEGVVAPEGLMRAAVEINGWQLDDEPLVYVGDSLFDLINGGAELYLRFGFVQALGAQYSDAEGRSISLEVFEMRDADGARNIYSEKAGGSGEQLDIGDEAAAESYYMNFRSDRYLVTITGLDDDPNTTDGILRLARAVAAELGGAR